MNCSRIDHIISDFLNFMFVFTVLSTYLFFCPLHGGFLSAALCFVFCCLSYLEPQQCLKVIRRPSKLSGFKEEGRMGWVEKAVWEHIEKIQAWSL